VYFSTDSLEDMQCETASYDMSLAAVDCVGWGERVQYWFVITQL